MAEAVLAEAAATLGVVLAVVPAVVARAEICDVEQTGKFLRIGFQTALQTALHKVLGCTGRFTTR
jgi:hypothetical protein